MAEALAARLAGEIDHDVIAREDYDAALEWVWQQQAKRERQS